MRLDLSQTITYLITSSTTTPVTTPSTDDFEHLLNLISAAVAAGVNLIQLREKALSARSLYELTVRAVELAQGSATRLLVNDRADIARAAGADGVHLTTQSLSASVVRRCFGSELLVGVSTHSLAEVCAAESEGADFAVFGPVFETPSKARYGGPLGLTRLAEAARTVAPFPVIALGGVTRDNASECLRAGARGVAGIRLFADENDLTPIVRPE